MKRVPSICYVHDVYRNHDCVYGTGNFMDSCIVLISFFLKISLTEENTAEPLMSGHARDVRKVSVTGAGHLQECKKYSHSVWTGVEKNKVL